MAYYSFDPWGGYRSDLQAAHQVAATIDYKGEIADLMLFDPDPLPPDEIKRNEDAALVAKLERETQQMAALFDIAEQLLMVYSVILINYQ